MKSKLLSFATLLCLVTSAQAAETPLAAIPSTAAAVVRIASPEQSLQTVADFAGKIDPQLRQIVMFGSGGMGMVIANPSRAGVDSNRDWWIAVLITDGRPRPVFAVPVTDAEKAKQATRKGAKFVEHDDWLIYSPEQSAIDLIQARIDGKGESITVMANEAIHEMFADSHIAAFVNLDRLTTEYAQQIRMVQQQIKQGMEQAANFAPEVQGIQLGPIFDLYGDMLDGVFQAADDAQTFAFAMRIDDDAIYFADRLEFADSSASAKTLSRQTVGSMATVDRLPEDELAYFGLRMDMTGLVEWGSEFWKAMLDEAAPDAAEKLEKAFADMKGIEFGGYYGSFNLGSIENGALQMTIVAEVSPLEKMKAASQSFSELSSMTVQGVEQEFDYSPAAEKAAGYDIDIIRVKQTVSPELDPLGIQNQIFEAMYGKDGLVSRMAYVKGQQIQSIGTGREGMANALKRLDSDVTNRDFDAVRGYGKDANFVMAMDLPRTIHAAISLVVENGQLPLPIDQDDLDELEFEPSYISVGAKVQGNAIRVDTRVPVEQLQGIAKMVRFFQSKMQPNPEL